jgi:hypothetical protein
MTTSIPENVTNVAGCDCGGTNIHVTTCSIFGLPPDEAMAAIQAANDRIQEWTDQLNASMASDGGYGCAYRDTDDRGH